MTSILAIDDDEKLLKLLTEYLAQHGMEVTPASTPELGLAILRKREPDLVILDVMLPGMNGFDVLKEIRRTRDLPVIMLTARGEVTDRIVGLELGSDDYLAKPFEPRELVARIQSVLRRGRAGAGTQRLAFGDLEIDMDAREVRLAGEAVELSTAEFDVLTLLAANPRRVYSREAIQAELKGSEWVAFDRAVDVLISRIRTKLGDDAKRPRFIKTIWGTGYKFVGRDDA